MNDQAQQGRPANRKSRTKPLCEGAVVLAIVIPMLIWFWPILTAPAGRDIPTEAPTEHLRVFHPDGFSIVAPPNWKTLVIGGSGNKPFGSSIQMYPGGPIARRYSAGIRVELLGTKPKDFSESHAATFPGLPAFEKVGTVADRGFENPGQFGYTIFCERDSKWFRFGYHIFSERHSLPKQILPFLETFKFNPRLTESSEAANSRLGDQLKSSNPID
jgi:hypothetical protein